LPQTAFLLAIAGVGMSLAGFSGLVLAIRRGAPLKPIDAYRLRLLPEMALATTFLALTTIPLADAIGNPTVTMQVASGLALLFTFGHIFRLFAQTRAAGISQPARFQTAIVVIDLLVLLVAAAGLAVGSVAIYEWVLVLLLARPALAFVFVLSEVGAG
jgi:hypothetical protein